MAVSPEELIRQACREHMAKGGKLRSGDWGVLEPGDLGPHWSPAAGGCCALGALLLQAQPPLVGTWEGSLAVVLGVSRDWVLGFVAGFDGENYDAPGAERREGYAVGRQLRQEFLGA